MRALGAFVIPALFAFTGCVTNHDVLAEPLGAGGANGGTPAGNGGAHPTTKVDGSVEPPDTGAPRTDAPTGPTPSRKLTLLHGVIDSPWIGFCFALVHDGRASPVMGTISPPGGLEYGHSTTLESVPGLTLGTDDFLPYVIAAASADVVAGMDCGAIVERAGALLVASVPDAASRFDASPILSDATTTNDGAVSLDATVVDASTADVQGRQDAAPPRSPPPRVVPAVRAAALSVLPGVALSAVESYLLLAGGCVGGPGVTDPSETSVCGQTYSSANPTLTETVVELPRVATSGRVGLALLDGTPAVPVVNIELDSPSGVSLPIVSNVVAGALRPSSPIAAYSASDIGASSQASAIWLDVNGSASPIYDAPWSTTFSAAGFDGLEDGQNYTLVVVGPYPGFSKRNWWNAPLVTIVRNGP